MTGAFYPVVPAGGSGTRLWPLSRSIRPKFLHPLTGGEQSLLQATVARLAPLASTDHILVVTGAAHAAAVAAQLPELTPANLVSEPAPRESGPAIALAAALIAERDPDGVMGSFAADHLIADLPGFYAAVRTAIDVADTGLLVTIGITPDRPETGYGYLRTGAMIGAARTVEQFKEKPDAATAAGYLASGHYLWNAGMFVWQVQALLEEIRRLLPDLHDGVRRIAAAYRAGDGPAVHARLWPTMPRVSIDVGIMEAAAAAGRVACVPGDFGWTDIGDWDTLGSVLPTDATGTVALPPAGVLTIDSTGCVVTAGPGRTVVLLGVEDLVVADVDDAVLVCPRGRAQDVGQVIKALAAARRTDLL